MNKVDWLAPGGAPLRNEDWDYQDQATRKAIAGLASVYGNNAILSGCAIAAPSGGSVHIDAGILLIEGEVIEVAAALITYNGPYYYFEVVEIDVADSGSAFENGTSPLIYKLRLATLVTYAAAQAETATRKAVLNMAQIPTVLSNYIKAVATQFTARQSWGVGTAGNAAMAGVSDVYLINALSGNTYDYDIHAADTTLTRFTAPMPNGTWLALRFTSADTSDKVVFGDGIALTNGIVTGGNEYVFSVGEVAWFVWMDGKAVLVNRENQNGWVLANPTVAGLGAAVTSIAAPDFRWLIEGKKVTCRFSFSTVHLAGTSGMYANFTLPFGMIAKAPSTQNAVSFYDLTHQLARAVNGVGFAPNEDYSLLHIGMYGTSTTTNGAFTGVISFEIE